MLNSKNAATALAALALLALVANPARADDYMIPVVYVGDESPATDNPSCKELRDAAWFINELARTDGDFNPQIPAVACKRELFAESTVDAD